MSVIRSPLRSPIYSPLYDPLAGKWAAENPHRYWRIEFTDNAENPSTTTYVISEIQLLESYAGGDLKLDSTMSTNVNAVSSASQDFSNLNGVDGALYGVAVHDRGGSNRTFAPTGWTGTHPYIDFDFGEGVNKSINIFRVGGTDAQYPHLVPTSFNFYHSDDGINWTPAWSDSVDSAWEGWEMRDFVRPGYSEPSYSGTPRKAYRHYRLLYFDVISPFYAYAEVEIEFRTISNGANIATGGTAGALYTNVGTPSDAFDADLDTFHAQNFSGGINGRKANQGMTYDLGDGNAAKVGEVAYRCRTDEGSGEHQQSPYGHAVQGSDDGTNWSTLWTGTFQSPTSGAVLTSTDPLYV